MGRADGSGLVPAMDVDYNMVISMVLPNKFEEHRVLLLTPASNWVCNLEVTGGVVIGNRIYAGNEAGAVCKEPNGHLKFAAVGLGTAGETQVAAQFRKPKILGIETDFGTRTWTLPAAEAFGGTCVDVVFYWPCDSEGDTYNTFKTILGELAGVVGKAEGIADECVSLGAAGAKLAACFA
eukprot:CAMPEP_0171185154 /NCGR_PEP_ID=MMETSP0790-20130122/16155_1 /TAXON_ID=2925 /ORGANISM="Alexandrium catenella, Strain OF101" /LENGTH=179 /DNA_ID=CAMNT_0011650167 /DNA_START=112 /DNA_END=651 /DNA_ORIENTATION=-